MRCGDLCLPTFATRVTSCQVTGGLSATQVGPVHHVVSVLGEHNEVKARWGEVWDVLVGCSTQYNPKKGPRGGYCIWCSGMVCGGPIFLSIYPTVNTTVEYLPHGRSSTPQCVTVSKRTPGNCSVQVHSQQLMALHNWGTNGASSTFITICSCTAIIISFSKTKTSVFLCSYTFLRVEISKL